MISNYIEKSQITNGISRSLQSGQKGFGYLLLVFTIFASFYLFYLCYQRWRSIRDFHVMEETREHTSELADMGMESEHGYSEGVSEYRPGRGGVGESHTSEPKEEHGISML